MMTSKKKKIMANLIFNGHKIFNCLFRLEKDGFFYGKIQK